MAEIGIKVKTDTSDADKSVAGFSDRAGAAGGKLTKGLTLPILGVGAALVGMGRKAGDNADRLFDMSAQTGVSTDKLQEFEYAATQAGVSQDFYKKSVEETIKNMDKYAKGTGPASDALDALGVSVRDVNGELKSGEQITDEAMAALAAIEDPTKRAAAAQDLFKGSNQDMLAFLSLGTEEIDKQRKAAHELGVVQSGESLEGANKFRAGMESLQAQVGGIVGMIGGEFAPLLSDVVMPLVQDHIVPAIRTFAEFVGKLADGFNNLSPKMKGIIGSLIGVAAVAGPLLVVGAKMVKMFGAIGKAFKALSLIMSMNPWALLAIAVVAIVALIVLNWDKIVSFLKGVFDWMIGKAKQVADWFMDTFGGMIDFIVNLFMNFTGPGLIIKHFDKIKDAAGVVRDVVVGAITMMIDLVKGLFRLSPLGLLITHFSTIQTKALEVKDWIVDKFEAVVGFFTEMPGRITNATSGMWDGIKSAFRGAANWVIDKWNGLSLKIGGATIDMPGPVPDWKIPSITLNTPNIPRFHSGGTFNAPPGRTEGLAILEDGERILRRDQGVGTTNIFVTVQGNVWETKKLASALRKEFLDTKRRNGSVGLS